jgi:hypothetical protein
MNGASEATLQELLTVAKAMNINLQGLVKASGGGTGAGGSGTSGVASAAASAASSFSIAGIAAKTVGGAFSLLGTIVGGVVGTFTDLAGNFYDFSKAAMSGTASLGQLAMVFKDIPGLGKLAPIIAEIFDYADKLSGFYRNMTKAGASFGGDLFAMSTAAAKSGLTLQSFSAIVSQNGELFSSMNLNVQTGVDKFVAASGALLGPGSKFSKQLFGLGISADESANALTVVMGRQGMMSAKEALTADQLAEKTKEYLVELDAMTKITGVSRQEAEAKMKELKADQSYQFMKSQLNDRALATVNSLEDIGKTLDPAIMDAIKFGTQGIVSPMTQAGIDFNTASKGLYTEIAQTVKNLKDAGASPEEVKRVMYEKLTAAGGNMVAWSKDLGEGARATNASILNANAKMLQMGIVMDKNNMSMGDAIEYAKKQQKAQADGSASSIGQANQSIQNFGNGLTAMMNRVLGPVTTKLAGWSETFMNGASDLVKPNGPLDGVLTDFMKQFDGVSEWLTKTFKFLKDDEEPGTFWEKLEVKAKEAWANIKTSFTKFMDSDMGKELKGFWENTVKPMFNEVLESIKSSLGTTFLGMMDWLIAQMRKNSTIAKFLFGETSTEKIEKNDTEVKRLKDQIRGFGEAIDSMSERQINSAKGRSVIQQNQTAVNRLAELERETALLKGEPVAPQPKAKGGPINAGSYLVGEAGPELLNVGASGNVVSNDSIAALLSRTGESDKAITSLMNMLNTQNKQMLSYIAEMTDYTKRNNDALKSMSGDAFA